MSRVERGHIASLSVEKVAAVCEAIDVRLDFVPRWRGGDLDRVLNSRHASLHEATARWFAQQRAEWTLVPEVTFALYGERGVIDILAWHAGSHSLLVIELKSEIVDVNELIGTLDRKRRLAPRIARERGWNAAASSAWVVIAPSRTKRRRVAEHAAVLRNALPHDGRSIRAWLGDPIGSRAALSLESFGATGERGRSTTKRVRCSSASVRPGLPGGAGKA